MRVKYTLQNLKKLPARAWWTFSNIPAGLRGELTAMYQQLSLVHIGADGQVIKDYGVVSRKKVTQVFVKDIVNAMAAVTAGGAGAGSATPATRDTGVTFLTFNDYCYHDSGVGTTAEANTDTAIETTDAESRVAGTLVSSGTTTGIYTSVGTIAYTTTKAITEHGLFNASSAGTLLDRSVFAAVNVVSGDSIQFTYTLTINPEA